MSIFLQTPIHSQKLSPKPTATPTGEANRHSHKPEQAAPKKILTSYTKPKPGSEKWKDQCEFLMRNTNAQILACGTQKRKVHCASVLGMINSCDVNRELFQSNNGSDKKIDESKVLELIKGALKCAKQKDESKDKDAVFMSNTAKSEAATIEHNQSKYEEAKKAKASQANLHHADMQNAADLLRYQSSITHSKGLQVGKDRQTASKSGNGVKAYPFMVDQQSDGDAAEVEYNSDEQAEYNYDESDLSIVDKLGMSSSCYMLRQF